MRALTGSLAEVLERRREWFNSRFAAAQRGGARIDAAAFLEHLRAVVAPIVDAVAPHFAEKVEPVAVAIYDLSIELFAANVLGPGTCCPPVVDAWRRLLPAVPRLLAREPARVAVSVTNAVHNVASTPGARAGEWVDAMLALSARVADVHGLLEAGKVLAWRCGMTRYRDGALGAARGLDAPLAAAALGLPADTARGGVDAVLDRLAADPWVTPADALANRPADAPIRIAARVGAFRGFGGPFLRPPTVRTVDGHFVVHDGDASWHLFADLYGHAFARVDVPGNVADRAARDVSARDDGTIVWRETAVRLDELAHPASVAFDGRTVAVTLAASHHVFLLARG